MNQPQAVIILAAGSGQISLLQKAKELGFSIIAVDRNPEAPGFAYADEVINQSTYDSGPIIKHLKELKNEYLFQGVLTKSSGIPVITAAEIAQEFNLPGIIPECAQKVVMKSTLMDMCGEIGIPVPWHLSAKSSDEVEQKRLSYPLVIKPSMTVVGKEGIFLVTSPEELKDKFHLTQKASSDGVVELEEYIEGLDVAYVGFFVKSKLYSVALLDELNQFDQYHRVLGLGFAVPSKYSDTVVEKEIKEVANTFVTGLQLGTGICYMAFRIRLEKNPVLIEVHLDLAGDYVPDKLFPASTDFDLLETTIQVFTGQPFSLTGIQFQPATIYYLFNSDLQSGGDGKLANLRQLSGIKELSLLGNPTGKGSTKRLGYILIQTGSRQANEQVMRKVDNILGRAEAGV